MEKYIYPALKESKNLLVLILLGLGYPVNRDKREVGKWGRVSQSKDIPNHIYLGSLGNNPSITGIRDCLTEPKYISVWLGIGITGSKNNVSKKRSILGSIVDFSWLASCLILVGSMYTEMLVEVVFIDRLLRFWDKTSTNILIYILLSILLRLIGKRDRLIRVYFLEDKANWQGYINLSSSSRLIFIFLSYLRT